MHDVLYLRGLLAEGNTKAYSDRKKCLEAVTFSGLFQASRVRTEVATYHQLCVFDIDHLELEALAALSSQLRTDPYVFAFWVSPSGAGIKGLVMFDYGRDLEAAEVPEMHKAAYRILTEYFSQRYGTQLDTSGSDVTRLCFLTWDANLHFRHEFERFPVHGLERAEKTEPKTAATRVRRSRAKSWRRPFDTKRFLNGRGKNRPQDRVYIQRAIKYLTKRSLSLTSTYERWVRIAFAIANSFSYDLGQRYFLQICRLDGDKHDEEKSLNLLQSCYESTRLANNFGAIRYYVELTKEKRGERLSRRHGTTKGGAL